MAPRKKHNKKEGGVDLGSGSTEISDSKITGRDYIEGFSENGVNQIIETLLKYFPKGQLQNPIELDKTFNKFRDYHKELHEYKELHNAINEIQINFEPFRTEIDRATFGKSITKLSTLQNLWRPVSLNIKELLNWSQNIQSIGEPFKFHEEDKSLSGEEWAIQFSGLQIRMNEHLGISSDDPSGKTPKKETDYPNQMQILVYQRLGKEILWWETLTILTSEFHDTGSHYMNTADKQLRKTAQELYNLSNKALSNI